LRDTFLNLVNCNNIQKFDGKQDAVRYTIKCKLVDGSYKNISYILPKDANLFIQGDRGSYSLVVMSKKYNFYDQTPVGYKKLLDATIDFEIIERKEIN
jgi:hypothetical protein